MNLKNFKSRKEKLEHLAWKGDGLSLRQYQAAWMALMTELEKLSHPEARMPKFNDLVEAIAKSQSRAKRECKPSFHYES